MTHPCPAREGSVIVMQVGLCAFNSAHSENTGSNVGPHHSNASTISVATNGIPVTLVAMALPGDDLALTRGKD
jgi:hypothetical protein